MYGYTISATLDALLDKLNDTEARQREAHEHLLRLAESAPEICNNPHYRAARLALVPTPPREERNDEHGEAHRVRSGAWQRDRD
jgi:hypothetical protein